MSSRFAIRMTADDMTGAADLATSFLADGLCTRILPHSSRRRGRRDAPFVGITIQDLDCRAIDFVSVARRVQAVAASWRGGRRARWYHKIDSGLRGTVGEQVLTLMRGLDLRQAVFVPANPLQGRTTRGGVHYVDDVPLADSPLRTDPTCPEHSRVAELVGGHSAFSVSEIPVECVVRGGRAIRDMLSNASDDGTLFVIDAVTEEHLRTIARAVMAFPLVIGSAGLARHLVPLWLKEGGRQGTRRKPALEVKNLPKGGMIIAGSNAPATRAQNEQFSKRADPRTRLIVFPPPGKSVRRRRSVLGEVKRNIRGAGRIVISGGGTAAHVCELLAVREIRMLRVIEPGIGVGIALGRHQFLVVLKPGSFGGPHLYEKALRTMADLQRGSRRP